MTVWLAVAAIVFAASCVASLVVLHLSPTGYSTVRNAVSEYAVGPYGGWYRAQAACAGLSALCLAGALARGIDPAPRRVIALLVVFAVARFAIGFFPTDLVGSVERTRTGGIHLLLAAAAFVSISLAASRLHRDQDGAPWLGYVMLATAVGTGVAIRHPALRPFLGLIERGFYAAFLAWLFLVSLRLAGA